jgi:hypothetical protein
MVAAGTSETSVNFYQTMRRCKPEDSHLKLYKYYRTGIFFPEDFSVVV